MKKLILFVLLLGLCFNLTAQNRDYKEKLTGTWYLPFQADDKKELTFEKDSFDKYQWGNYITILSNGELIVGYSAPCGNDPNIFRQQGKWKYNDKTNEFSSSISIYKRGKQFKIVELTNRKLILK